MKKNKIYSILAAALLFGAAPALTSCEDLLEKPSFTADDLDFVFSDEDKAELYVKGCYRALVFSELWRLFIDPGVTVISEDAIDGGRPRSANFAYDPILPATATTVYSQSYKTIESCNVALKRLAGLHETAKLKALKAEVTFIRAFAYNELIRFYGDVPAAFSPISEQQDQSWYPKRTSRDEIYDRIIGEMQDCVDDLPWFSESNYGSAPERLTRQAAKGILARICLYAGGYSLRWDIETNDASSLHFDRRPDEARVKELYEIADAALAEVIGKGENSLITQGRDGMSPYHTLFYNYCQRNFGVSSQEMMWQIAQLGESTNSDFGIYNGQPGCMGGPFGGRKTLQVKLPTYYLSFDPADMRRDVICANYSITFLSDAEKFDGTNCATTFSSIMPGKYRIQWCQAPQAAAKRNVDVPLLRYADILLMYAETQNYLHGPNDAAKAALKQVRDRAGIGAMPIAAANKEEFLETIMQERKWELGDELLVRGDLIRMNLIEKEVRQAQQDIKDLSDRTGKYADVPALRIVKLQMSSCEYGEKALTVPYIEISDPAEISKLTAMKNASTASNRNKHNQAVKEVLAAHGITPSDSEVWYTVNMFQAWTSTYNKNSRRCAGYSPAAITALNIGSTVYTKPLASSENNGAYPDWVAGEYGIYHGFVKNKTEICPFAGKSAGHPLIDNPNLTQHPAYK